MRRELARVAEQFDDVRSVRRAGEVCVWPAVRVFGGESEVLFDDFVVDVDLVRRDEDRHARPVLLQLFVPLLQVLVRDLARHVKHEDATVGAMVIRRMHRTETLLTGSVLKATASERERERESDVERERE